MFVDPPDIVVSTPASLIVATAVLEEAHVYVKVEVPVAFDVSVKEPPIHIAVSPVIAFATGAVFIVIVNTFD